MISIELVLHYLCEHIGDIESRCFNLLWYEACGSHARCSVYLQHAYLVGLLAVAAHTLAYDIVNADDTIAM